MMFDALANPSETDFGKEVIPGLLGKAKLGAYIFEGYWEDIGTVRAFFDANLSLADPQPPFNFYERGRTIYTHARFLPASKVNGCQLRHAIVADGCIIEDANLNRCSIGVRSVIGGGTQLKNTVMMGADFFEDDEDRTSNKSTSTPNVGIGANCIMQDAIIDKNARIGDNVKLSPVGVPDMWESTDGSIIVRDGVLVVLKDATVPSGTVVGKLD